MEVVVGVVAEDTTARCLPLDFGHDELDVISFFSINNSNRNVLLPPVF
jgi:hypothetical protein